MEPRKYPGRRRATDDARWHTALTEAARGGTFAARYGDWVREWAGELIAACGCLARRQREFDARTAAEELFAETVLVGLRRLPAVLLDDGRPLRSVVGFVLSTCLRAAYEKLGFRKRSRGKRQPAPRVRRLDEPGTAAAGLPSPDEGPEVACERKELSERLWAAIDRLPPYLREVLVLNHFEGMTLEQMSARFGVPVGTLKTRSVKARRLLREMLGGEGDQAVRPPDEPVVVG
jgi:RNA polymerase sigma factor (sigma-70 family)